MMGVRPKPVIEPTSLDPGSSTLSPNPSLQPTNMVCTAAWMGMVYPQMFCLLVRPSDSCWIELLHCWLEHCVGVSANVVKCGFCPAWIKLCMRILEEKHLSSRQLRSCHTGTNQSQSFFVVKNLNLKPQRAGGVGVGDQL